MRLIKYLVLAVIALALVIVSMANDGPMTLKLIPDELARVIGYGTENLEITLPVFAILLGAMLVGVFLGFVWEWVREHKHRAAAASERSERKRLERQVKQSAPAGGGDDVLAILDGN